MKRLLALAGLAALTFAITAEAHRAPTSSEQTEIAQAAGFPRECARVIVSTRDQSWSRAADNHAACNGGGDGLVILHRKDGAWGIVDENSEFDSACPLAKVPAAVGLNLNVCHKRRTYIRCRRTGHDFRDSTQSSTICAIPSGPW